MTKYNTVVEWLMTYGWAMLIILIVAGTLAYYGIFSPSGFTASYPRCEYTFRSIESNYGQGIIPTSYFCQNIKQICSDMSTTMNCELQYFHMDYDIWTGSGTGYGVSANSSLMNKIECVCEVGAAV
jgi:hypothetical protein